MSAKARRRVQREDLEWADLIFVMTYEQRERLVQEHRGAVRAREVAVLEIPDEYAYMDPELVELLRERAGPAIDQAPRRGAEEAGDPP